jgi:uncharacterized protein
MRTVVGLALAGVFIAVGLAFAAVKFSESYIAARTVDRVVTVKGLAERDVKADLALWPIKFTTTHDDLSAALQKIAADEKQVRAFLTAGGITPDAISVQQFAVIDQLAQQYRSGPIESRYIVSETLLARSGDVDSIEALAQQVGELVGAGVILSNDGGPAGPTYLYTKLNDIKPAMLAEAVASAREGAKKFAEDANAHVGGIRRAYQGIFQILARDNAPGLYEASQINKTIRVVSTIDYALVD